MSTTVYTIQNSRLEQKAAVSCSAMRTLHLHSFLVPEGERKRQNPRDCCDVPTCLGRMGRYKLHWQAHAHCFHLCASDCSEARYAIRSSELLSVLKESSDPTVIRTWESRRIRNRATRAEQESRRARLAGAPTRGRGTKYPFHVSGDAGATSLECSSPSA